MAVKKNANARTAAQTPTIWNRSAWLTSAFQFLGGALGCQVSVALLIGTVPMTLITIQMSMASTPAHRNPKPGAAPSRTVTAIPDTAVGTKKAGTSTRSLQYQCLAELELRLFVQNLGGRTQTVVDHELYASQDTGEEHIHDSQG